MGRSGSFASCYRKKQIFRFRPVLTGGIRKIAEIGFREVLDGVGSGTTASERSRAKADAVAPTWSGPKVVVPISGAARQRVAVPRSNCAGVVKNYHVVIKPTFPANW